MPNFVLFELTLKLEHYNGFIIILLIMVTNIIPQHQRPATPAAQALIRKEKKDKCQSTFVSERGPLFSVRSLLLVNKKYFRSRREETKSFYF